MLDALSDLIRRDHAIEQRFPGRLNRLLEVVSRWVLLGAVRISQLAGNPPDRPPSRNYG